MQCLDAEHIFANALPETQESARSLHSRVSRPGERWNPRQDHEGMWLWSPPTSRLLGYSMGKHYVGTLWCSNRSTASRPSGQKIYIKKKKKTHTNPLKYKLREDQRRILLLQSSKSSKSSNKLNRHESKILDLFLFDKSKSGKENVTDFKPCQCLNLNWTNHSLQELYTGSPDQQLCINQV